MFYDITPEELQAIKEYVEGNGPLPESSVIIRYNALGAALNKRLVNDLSTSKSKEKRLEKRVQSFKAKEEDRAAAGVFAETVPGLDSLDLARALVWCLSQKQTYQFNKNKVVAILYEMYASWLASKHERLFAQHPQASPYGPQLWRVFTKLTSMNASYDDFKKIAEASPAIAAFTKNAAEKYYDWKLSDITKGTKNSKPFLNATPEHNNGKWSKDISDADIYEWRVNKER